MKPTFLQVGEEGMLPELVQNPAYGLNVRLSGVFGIAPTVQSIELLGQPLIDVARKRVLEGAWFDTRVDRYGSGGLFLNYCFHKSSSHGVLTDPTG